MTLLRGKPVSKATTGSFEIETALQMNGAAEAGWKIEGKDGTYILIGYDAVKQEVFVNRTHSLFRRRRTSSNHESGIFRNADDLEFLREWKSIPAAHDDVDAKIDLAGSVN